MIRDYLDNKFRGLSKISGNGQELLLPSIFVDGDTKYHFSINLFNGLWQDFKAGKSGNFIQLYAELEGKSYKAAETDIIFKSLQSDPADNSEYKELKAKYSIEEEMCNFIPIGIPSISSTNELDQELLLWLLNRKLLNTVDQPVDDFYYCTEGRYKERLIIPYRKNGKLVYFQGRSYTDRQPKYLNPSTEHGIKSSNLLYPFETDAQYVVVCEGPLDAISLKLQGVNATCTQGTNVSREQMRQLREFGGSLVVAYDNDDAGNKGANGFVTMSKKMLISPVYRLTPPKGFKDWNEAHVNGTDLLHWFTNKTEVLDFDQAIRNALASL